VHALHLLRMHPTDPGEVEDRSRGSRHSNQIELHEMVREKPAWLVNDGELVVTILGCGPPTSHVDRVETESWLLPHRGGGTVRERCSKADLECGRHQS
jgi:hypothetical protein